MNKIKTISFRITETDFKKILAMKNGKSITNFFTELLKQAFEKERQEAITFLELIKKIDNSDLSKISQKLDLIISDIKKINLTNDPREKEKTESLSEELKIFINVIEKNYKATIEIINILKGTLYAQSFETKLQKGGK